MFQTRQAKNFFESCLRVSQSISDVQSSETVAVFYELFLIIWKKYNFLGISIFLNVPQAISSMVTCVWLRIKMSFLLWCVLISILGGKTIKNRRKSAKVGKIFEFLVCVLCVQPFKAIIWWGKLPLSISSARNFEFFWDIAFGQSTFLLWLTINSKTKNSQLKLSQFKHKFPTPSGCNGVAEQQQNTRKQF